MPDDSMRTVLVALGSGLAVAFAKVGVAVVTGSAAMAAEAAHSLGEAPTTCSSSSLSVAAPAALTTGIPWGTGGKPTSGR